MSAEAYFNNLDAGKKKICLELRRIILKTLPGIKEELRYGVPWYGKFYVAAVKHGVNLGFSVKGLSEDELKHFNGKGKFMRHLKFESVREIKEKELVNLLKRVDKKAICEDCS